MKNAYINNKEAIKKRGPIQNRILAISLGGIIFVCLLISVISFYIFNNYLRDELTSTTRNSLLNLSISVDKDIQNVYRLVRYCQGSSNIAAYIESSDEDLSDISLPTYERLYEEYQNNEFSNNIPRVCIVSGNHYLQVCSTSYSTTVNLSQEIPKLDFFQDLLSADEYLYTPGIINDPFLKRPRPVIPIIRPITYMFNSDQGGYLYMEFSTDAFLSHMNHYYMENGSELYLIVGDHLYLYEEGALIEQPNRSLDVTRIKSSYNNTGTISSTFDSEKGPVNVVAVPLLMNDCYLVQSISPSSLNNIQAQFILLFSFILLSVIAIGIIINYSFSRHIMKPLAILRERIALTSSGDFSVDRSIEWDDELGEIGKGINDLSESINNLLESRLENEKQKRDLEYKMLQSQINPHFLYNTLNSIKMMATIQGATGISDMTTALASLLRSISKGTSLLIPISEEVKLIKDYFTIQNYRYGGMIRMNVDVADPSILDCCILKFTLQPLVENAVFHGLEPKGGTGSIDIRIFTREDSTICIDVTDDGIGISKEKITEILSGSSTSKAEFFKEIGVNNVNKRLQYEFGEQYGIFITSELGHGTTMSVVIPARKYQQEETNEV